MDCENRCSEPSAGGRGALRKTREERWAGREEREDEAASEACTQRATCVVMCQC